MQPRVRDQRLFASLLGALIALAWLSLWIWRQSPYGRFLSHKQNEGVHSLGSHYLVLSLLFVAGWTLMTVAMMLPTSLPLVTTFRALVRQRPDRLRLVTLLIVGYLCVWTAFAFVAHVGDLGIHRAVDQIGWLHAHAWLIGAATVLWAGIYQFTPLKYRCLEKCRSPLSFVMVHWRGGNPHLQALRLGVSHGMFCVGCCWSLMLLMFAVGAGNLGWMLALGAVMAAEKNASWGRRLRVPLGIGLASCGLVLLALQIGLPGTAV
jgi:predicted metal-binding membrane protein